MYFAFFFWASSDDEDNDSDIVDVHSLTATVHIHFTLHSARYPGLVPYQLPDPQQPARPLADLLTAIAALARRQPHNAPLLHSAWTNQEMVTEEYCILGQLRGWHASLDPSLQAASPFGVSSLSCLIAGSFHWFLSMCLLGMLKILLTRTFQSSHSLWTRGPAMRDAPPGFSRARSGSVFKWLECA